MRRKVKYSWANRKKAPSLDVELLAYVYEISEIHFYKRFSFCRIVLDAPAEYGFDHLCAGMVRVCLC